MLVSLSSSHSDHQANGEDARMHDDSVFWVREESW
jgi:hypothetical protein